MKEFRRNNDLEICVIRKSVEKGIGIGVEKTAVNLLLSRLLNKEQISEITGLDREKPDELERKLKAE